VSFQVITTSTMEYAMTATFQILNTVQLEQYHFLPISSVTFWLYFQLSWQVLISELCKDSEQVL